MAVLSRLLESLLCLGLAPPSKQWVTRFALVPESNPCNQWWVIIAIMASKCHWEKTIPTIRTIRNHHHPSSIMIQNSSIPSYMIQYQYAIVKLVSWLNTIINMLNHSLSIIPLLSSLQSSRLLYHQSINWLSSTLDQQDFTPAGCWAQLVHPSVLWMKMGCHAHECPNNTR